MNIKSILLFISFFILVATISCNINLNSNSTSLSSSSDSANNNTTPVTGSSSENNSSSSDSSNNSTTPVTGSSSENNSSSNSSSSSSSASTECNIYISTTSTNSNYTCGSSTDPCENLSDAFAACVHLNQTANMVFNFGAGIFTIDNTNQYLTIYNQELIFLGDKNGGTVFQFSNPDQRVIVINEPDISSVSDQTTFMISNITVEGLNNTFIKASTNLSNLQVLIDRSTFKDVALAWNFIQITGINSSLVTVSVTDSTFTNFNYTGAIKNSPGLVIYASNAYTTISNCTFTKVQGEASAIFFIGGITSVYASEFSNNTASSLIYLEKQYSDLNIIGGNIMSNNNLIGASSYIVYSFSSYVAFRSNSIQNNFISGFYNIDVLNLTSSTKQSSFAFNVIDNNKVTNGNGFIVAQTNTNLIAYENNFQYNILSNCFSGYQAQTLEISDNLFYNNSGTFTQVSECNSVSIFSNQATKNYNFEFLNCAQSSISAGLNNNVNISKLYANGDIVCGDQCDINNNGCKASSEAPTKKPSDNNSDKKTKIIIIATCVSVAGVAILASVVYYLAVYRKRHSYSRIN